MKTKIILLLLFMFGLNILVGQSKEKRKQLKEEKSQKEYVQIKEIVEFKKYLFEINKVIPNGGPSINVSGHSYYIEITMDSIYTSIPYFGKVHTSGGYGNNGGVSFDGYIDDYSVTLDDTSKKVTLKISSKKDNERIEFIINVYNSGNSSIMMKSMNRSTIRYLGQLRTKSLLL